MCDVHTPTDCASVARAPDSVNESFHVWIAAMLALRFDLVDFFLATGPIGAGPGMPGFADSRAVMAGCDTGNVPDPRTAGLRGLRFQLSSGHII